MKQFRKICIYSVFISTVLSANPGLSQLPFADGFESGDLIAGGWTVSGSSVVSTQSPASGMYCLEGNATWGISKTFAGVSAAAVSIEFMMKASQTNTTCMVFRIKDNPGNTSAGLFFDNNGNIMGVNGAGGSVVLMPFTASTWYPIRFELDMIAKTYDIYINAVLLADDYAFYSPGFTTPELFTWSSIASSGSAWLDDIHISGGFAGMPSIQQPAASQPVILQYQNELTILADEGMNLYADLFSLSGFSLLYWKLSGGSENINLRLFPAGCYVLHIRDKNNHVIKKQKVIVK